MKKILRTFIVLTAFVVTLSPMSQHIASAETTSKNHDYQTEVFFDGEGNKIELEYILNDEGLRVNNYVNGKLVEYSTRAREGSGLSDEIVNYFVDSSVESKGLNNNEITKGKTYSASELVNVKDEFVSKTDAPIETLAVPGGYKWVRSLNHTGYNLIGHLYLNQQISNSKSYEFDFAKGVAISVVSSAISYMFGSLIVAVGVLLSSLGISYADGVLKESLNGWYNGYKYTYNYLVQVKNKNVLWHKQDKISVTYYSSNTGKKSTRTKNGSTWLKETDLLNDGINNYVYGRY